MAHSPVRSVYLGALRRGLAALMLTSTALAYTGAAAPVQAQQRFVERTFTISGTVVERRGDLLVILTSDVIGREQPITVDVSRLRGLQIRVDDPISLEIRSRQNDTFLATGIDRESPFVNRLEFGVREEFTVKQDSIQAGVGNVPTDDEALAKQRRDHNLRRQEDDDEDDKKGR